MSLSLDVECKWLGLVLSVQSLSLHSLRHDHSSGAVTNGFRGHRPFLKRYHDFLDVTTRTKLLQKKKKKTGDMAIQDLD
jgi:hypothetical protein